MKEPKRYLVTAALPYANGPLHIGHIAGGYLSADIYVRYKRMLGEDVAFICGSDEHGAAITIQAIRDNTTPQAIVDRYHAINKQAFADFGIEFDEYHRTSDALHHETAQEFFKVLDEKNAFTKETSQQYFDAEKEQFLADRYITGECPKCSHPKAYGDQCENCGSALSPTDLINPRSTLSGSEPILKETTHWFLPMDQHESWLKPWLKEGMLDGKQHHDPKTWKRNVLGQCMSWIEGGLQPRAMTRDLDWGVKVPREDADGKVMYVWLDAPIGYISATKKWAAENGKNWEDYWKSDDTALIHFLGKDNIVFHCIIFPIILKTHGDFVLPTNVPANEFLNLESMKISTSRNYAVWLHEYLEQFPGRQDELRHVLTAISPENKDAEFTWEDYARRVNKDLAGGLGNFVNRAIVLTNKNFEGKVPDVDPNHEVSVFEGKPLMDYVAEAYAEVGQNLDAFRFKAAQEAAHKLVTVGDQYLTHFEPWKLIKTDPEKTAAVLHFALQLTAHLGVIFKPLLPRTASKIFGLVNLDESTVSWGKSESLLPNGQAINKQELLFNKIDPKDIAQPMEALELRRKEMEAAEQSNPDADPQKADMTFDDFQKMDLRVGTILEAERVPKTDALLKLKVDTGIDQRTVVSGIAKFYKPEDLIGQQVTMIINLAPRKIRGVESQGMILMAENAEKQLTFVSPADAFAPGSTVR